MDYRKAKGYLFGSWDRGLATVSCSFSIVGLLLTAFIWKFPETIPQLIILRDIIIILAFLIAFSVLLTKYIHREAVLSDQVRQLADSNQNLKSLLDNAHSAMHKFRDHCFKVFRPMVTGTVASGLRAYNEDMTPIFEKICHSLTTDLRSQLRTYLASKFGSECDEISISVKLVSEKMNSTSSKSVSAKNKNRKLEQPKYVITAYRDPGTYEKGEREVRKKTYEIEKNTVFVHVLRNQDACFCNNNLSALGGAFLNQNGSWREQYNATIAVPIRYLEPTSQACVIFGVLTADSSNRNNKELFDKGACKHIVAQTADLLAVYFLMAEMGSCIKNGDTHGEKS